MAARDMSALSQDQVTEVRSDRAHRAREGDAEITRLIGLQPTDLRRILRSIEDRLEALEL